MNQTISTSIKRQNIKYMTTAGLFAALITVTTAFILHIPFGVNGGYIHLGDTLIYLAATILPGPYAILAAALGGLFADLLTAPVWAPATFLIKGLVALAFTSKKATIVNARNIAALFIAAIISITGYYIAEVILFGNAAVALVSIVSSSIQAISSGVLFVVLGATLDKVRFKNRF